MHETASLDPQDWAQFRIDAHAALDIAISHMQGRGAQPVWQPVPDAVKSRLSAPPPLQGTGHAALIRRISEDFLPHDVGNTHGRFFGWVHGAGTPGGLIPEIFAAAMNANLGGREHVANHVEKQVIAWCRDAFGFPAAAGGLIVSGTSMATLIALKAARDKVTGMAARTTGTAASGKRLVGYASEQAHSCNAQAFDMIGLGSDALRAIPVDADFRMIPEKLEQAIAADRDAGHQPFCLIGTAGTVNTGSVDPLDTLADIAQGQSLWYHIDGAFGALAYLSETLKPLLNGLSRADSLAFDFHKWLHVNYDAGFVLMRDAEDQRRAFSDRPDYLQGSARGLAAGNPWFCEYGPELSRGFRALKVWYHMSEHGLPRFGEKIAENCKLAARLSDLVTDTVQITLLAPTALNICCFRYDPGGMPDTALDDLNAQIVEQLQLRGLAAPSTTRINRRLAIRVNITNHRTTAADIDFLVAKVLDLGRELAPTDT